MLIEDRLKLIKEVGEEIVQEEELKKLLESGEELIAYDGFEPSGQIHIAQGIVRAINVNKMIKAGVKFRMWVADWHAMARYKFKIVEEFQILIRHFLMKRKDVDVSQIKIIMAHSQNFRQCKNNLAKKYPNLKQVSGQGDLLDTARCAEALAKNKIDRNTAILGPKILAKIYDLDIIDENLQDSENNLTTFFLVSR